jgi:hypothetical protein
MMCSEFYSTDQRAKLVLDDLKHGLRQLEIQFAMSHTNSTIEGSFVEVIYQNDVTFVRVTWSPRDGLRYHLGPLRHGEVPPRELTYRPGQSLRDYELEWFMTLNRDNEFREIRGKTGEIVAAAQTAVEIMIKNGTSFLIGDWSRRSELDELVKRNYELRQER